MRVRRRRPRQPVRRSAAEAVLRDNRPWSHNGVLADVTIPVTILRADPAVGAMFKSATVNAAAENPAPDGPARRVARDHLARHEELLTALAAETGVADRQLVGRLLLILLEGATVVAALTGDLDAATDARSLARSLLAPSPA
jgi:hypothetical protein